MRNDKQLINFRWCTQAALTSILLTVSPAIYSVDDKPESELEPLKPLPIHPRTVKSVVDQVRYNHFIRRKRLDDTASSQIFDRFFEVLDRRRQFFLQSDINEFDRYRFTIDDALKHGRLEIPYEIYNRYRERVVEQFLWNIERLQQGMDSFDLNSNKTIAVDRSESPWLGALQERNELWERILIDSILIQKIAVEKSSSDSKMIDVEESTQKRVAEKEHSIVDRLIKRYKSRVKQARHVNSEDVFHAYVNAFTNWYDPHTAYLSPRISDDFNMSMSLKLEGIGARLQNEDDHTIIVDLITGGPADKHGGIRANDRIISVGQDENGPLIDVVGWRLQDVVDMIRGPKDTKVVLELLNPDVENGGVRKAVITRDTIRLEDQAAKKKVIPLSQDDSSYRIGVIEIPAMYMDFACQRQNRRDCRSSTTDVRKLIHELKNEDNIDGLIVDLRENGGGALEEATSLVGLFISSGPTVQVRDTRQNSHIHRDRDGRIEWEGPLAVLVNHDSASASEIFAAAIQDYRRGLVIGFQTHGKGTVQTLLELNRGQLKITQGKFYRISGQSTQKRGVEPDIKFPSANPNAHDGESTYENALPWDEIEPVKYDLLNGIEGALDPLRDLHELRIAQNPDFEYIRGIAAKIRENQNKKFISLSESTRLAEKLAEESWQLEIENARLVAKGMKPVQDLEELSNRMDELRKQTQNQPDPFLLEAVHILADYINIAPTVAHVNQPRTVQ